MFQKEILVLNVIFFIFFNFPLFHRFSLVKEHLIEFNQLAMANSEGSDNMLNRVMPKDNIGLAALLKTKEAAWENGMLYNFYFSLYVFLSNYIYNTVD